MKEEKLKQLSSDELQEKMNNHKLIMGITTGMTMFFMIIIGADYLNGKEVEMINLIMIPCLITGIVALFPEIKAIQKEIEIRNKS